MNKKMILAILDDTKTSTVIRALQSAGHPVTLIDSTGGLLRQGKSTLISGVDEKDVNDVIGIINQLCKPSVNPFQKKVTIMVLAVDHFEQIA